MNNFTNFPRTLHQTYSNSEKNAYCSNGILMTGAGHCQIDQRLEFFLTNLKKSKSHPMLPLVLLSFILIHTSHAQPKDAQPKWEEQLIDDKVSIGYGLAIGDVDGDGKPDILLADKKQFVWYRNGDWKRFVIADNLTERDNVCIAARDIDGDGKVEIAVGAQWNPAETSDTLKSGAVFYLIRPNDPTQQWKAVKLHHEPVTHRMKWVKAGNRYHLIVLPLHGRGNKDGEGLGVKVFAYEMPANPETQPWKLSLLDASMHLTHNLDVVSERNRDVVYIGGKEGIKAFVYDRGKWTTLNNKPWVIQGHSFGELRVESVNGLIAGIEPMHGTDLTVYSKGVRTLLTSDLKQGHALAVADILGTGNKQVVVGWREPDKDGKVGVKLFVPDRNSSWQGHWVDDNGMACEDLVVADLNGDGKNEIIAAGRASKNLKVYWNRSTLD
jgi:hypothetical protein